MAKKSERERSGEGEGKDRTTWDSYLKQRPLKLRPRSSVYTVLKRVWLYQSVAIYRRRKSPRVGRSRRNLRMKFAVPGIFTNGSARHVINSFASVNKNHSMELKEKQDWKSVIDSTDTFLFDCDGKNYKRITFI